MQLTIIRRSARATAFCLGLAVVGSVATPAQAGWLADFLCWSDNQPALCRSHLPDWALRANLPDYSSEASAVLFRASQMKGDKKVEFLTKNSAILGGPKEQKR